MIIMTEPAENLHISPEYQEEIEKIREDVKHGKYMNNFYL
jgi:hypothetical protein